ncbi:MAG: hypothetical protein P8R54_27675 [Myxococcota bacterium]|nr:hypothetical protein [Myxococcota bacterium]
MNSPSGGAPVGEDEIERILRETQEALAASDGSASAATSASSPPAVDATPVAPPSAPRSAPVGALAAENSLAEIYMASGVPDSPFPVEKLLKMLDGLQALPVASRKAAVLALDSADDNWSIADVILDAQRKTRALREEQARLDSHLSATDAQAQTDIASAEAYLEQATATIREQIAELETMLQQEIQQVATQKAEITHTLQSSRDAAARQRARLDNEIARIAKIPLTFGNIES